MREEPSMNFDTHKSIKYLIEKGIKEPQAESIVDIVSKSREYNFSKLATKDQLKMVQTALKGDIKSVEQELKGDIKSVEQQLRGEIKSVEQQLRREIKSVEQQLRGEIQSVEQKLEGKITTVEEKLRGEIIATKHDILRWVIPFLVGNLLTVLAMFVTMLVIFFRH